MMKFSPNMAIIASIACAQLWVTPIAHAATIDDAPQVGRDAQFRSGTFAGGRIRLAMGGQKRATKLRAGLTFAAMQSGRSARGASFTRFGEGLEFGITDRAIQPHMSIAGYSLAPRRLGAAEGEDDKGDKKGRSALGTAALIAGGVLVGAAGLYVVLVSSFDSD